MNTALITGAAGGVGRALAIALDLDGYTLILTDRDLGALQCVAETVSTSPELIVGDLRKAEDLSRLCARLESQSAPVDLLINNAGIIVPSAVSDISNDLLRAHIDINLTAPMVLSAASARAMKARRQGQIFSIISLAGIVPMKNSAAYSASKFGMRGFKAALSMELSPYGIRVGSLFPGAINTPMLADEMASPDGSPLNFVGGGGPCSPQDIAQIALKSMAKNKLETHLPRSEGLSGGIVMTFPSLLSPITSHLAKKGEKRKQAFLAKLNQSES